MSAFNYHGNRKAYAAVLCHSSDTDGLKLLFEALEAKGLRLCIIDEKHRAGSIIRKACGVISVFSKNFFASEALQSLFLAADSSGKSIVPLRSDGTALPELFSRLAYANNSVDLARYTPESAAERIMHAGCFNPPKVTREQTGAYKKTAAALIAAAVAVAAITAVPVIVKSSSDVAEETEEAVTIDTDDIAARFGLTAEELAKIKVFMLDGDRYEKDADEHSDHWSFLYENREDDERTWIRIDDGSEVEKGTIEDFSFLTMLPDLRRIILVNQSAKSLPDLSSLNYLDTVYLIDCDFESLDGLKDCRITTLNISLDNITDLSPLGSCPYLSYLTIDNCDNLNSIDGLEAAPYLRTLQIYCNQLEDISAFKSMDKLLNLQLDSDSIIDYSPLSGCSKLQTLQINNNSRSIDLSFVSALTCLQNFSCSCPDCSNLDAFSSAGSLHTFNLNFTDESRTKDLSFLKDLSINQLSLNGVNTDFRFLERYNRLTLLQVSSDGLDWSGLEALNKIDELRVDCWGNGTGNLFDKISGVEVKKLTLNNCGTPDLTKLPDTVSELYIERCNNTDLEGISCLNVNKLELSGMNRMKSLKGIETLAEMTELTVNGCVRISDWSALYELDIKELTLANQYILPDFSQLSFGEYGHLRLDSIPGLTELSCLDALGDEYAKNHNFLLDVLGNELFNLSALERFSARRLTVSPSLADQAADLVKKGCFNIYKVETSSYDSYNAFENFTLESLDELYSFPDALLAKVKRLYIGGNEVYGNGWFNWNGDTGRSCEYTFCPDGDSDDIVIEDTGSIKDFSILSKLTDLEELILVKQPVESLDGIQYLSNLRRLEFVGCDSLEDISPAFALNSLEELRLEHCAKVTSINGIQNLSRLRRLNIKGTPVTDYSPLEALNPGAYAEDGFQLEIMAYDEKCMPDDFSFLSGITRYNQLQLHGCSSERWLEFIGNCEINEADLFNCFESQEAFETFIGMNPGIKKLTVSWNDEITDLGCVLNLENLEYIRVSKNMKAAIKSLDGRSCSFEFEIEG